ncbi:MAG TPA: nickel ABC transporter permease [Thermoanaerobaculia bacterium]|nr:nickel ABC transporter permease [Thermoanaerobaculia bacterium]
MLRFALARLAQAVPVALAVATLVFALIHLVPGDPVELMLGEGAQAADVAALRERLGLDRPLGEQYLEFLGGLLRGRLGTSLTTGRPVTTMLLEHYPATLELAAGAFLVGLLVALPLGAYAAVRRGRPADEVVRVAALAGVSMPSFWLGPLLILLFAVQWDLLPVAGREGAASVVLPSLTLGAGLAGLLTRIVRSALADELERPYTVTARAKGLGRRRVLVRHALRNALVPVVTVAGLQFGVLLTGAIITETIFAWPGLGRLLIQAIRLRDYPLVQGAILAIALTYVLVNLLTDLTYAWLDPRIRLGGEAS